MDPTVLALLTNLRHSVDIDSETGLEILLGGAMLLFLALRNIKTFVITVALAGYGAVTALNSQTGSSVLRALISLRRLVE